MTPVDSSSDAVSPVGDKCIWTLVRPEGAPITEFQQYVLEDLGKAAGNLLTDATGVMVTLQEPNAFSGAIVRVGAADRRVDAVLQVTSSGSYVATDTVNAVLSANCGHVQGWRVRQTTIFDESDPVQPVARIPHIQMLWINQRMDGTTPEFYNRNWYIHAGHLDGEEAESEDSRRVHTQRGERTKGHWYIQNRVLEPITPTAWVVNGFSDYLADGFLPGPGERYDPKAGLGEESFDKWPPRLVQGVPYRVL
jgi:hypothetical protein